MLLGLSHENAPGFTFTFTFIGWGNRKYRYYVTNASTWRFSRFNSLLTQKFGVINGYAYGGEVDAVVKRKSNVLKNMSGIDPLEKDFKN